MAHLDKAEIDVFLELSCSFHDPADGGNLISGSSAFFKTSLNICKFTVHVLLKPGLENFARLGGGDPYGPSWAPSLLAWGGVPPSPSECPRAVVKVGLGADRVTARGLPISSLDGGTLFAPMSHKGVS